MAVTGRGPPPATPDRPRGPAVNLPGHARRGAAHFPPTVLLGCKRFQSGPLEPASLDAVLETGVAQLGITLDGVQFPAPPPGRIAPTMQDIFDAVDEASSRLGLITCGAVRYLPALQRASRRPLRSPPALPHGALHGLPSLALFRGARVRSLARTPANAAA